MSIILTLARHPDRVDESRGHSPADRYAVNEQSRETGFVAAVLAAYSTEYDAHDYAAGRIRREPDRFGADATHELVVVDTWQRRWHS